MGSHEVIAGFSYIAKSNIMGKLIFMYLKDMMITHSRASMPDGESVIFKICHLKRRAETVGESLRSPSSNKRNFNKYPEQQKLDLHIWNT